MDASTFGDFYEKTYGRILAYCLSRCRHNEPEAEDCAAETYERAYTRLDQLKSDDDDGQRSWLFTIARNVVISHYRRRCKELSIDDIEARPALWYAVRDERSDHDPEANSIMQEDLAALGEQITALPERQREALYLKAIVGLSRDEIAQIMATSEVNVRVMSWRAHHRVLAGLGA